MTTINHWLSPAIEPLPKKFPGSPDEKALNGILYNLDVAGRMLKLGAILLEDASIFEFESHRVLRNPQVGKYFRWLRSQIETLPIKSFPFEHAEYLARELLD